MPSQALRIYHHILANNTLKKAREGRVRIGPAEAEYVPGMQTEQVEAPADKRRAG
jgi:hypothetical protein